MNTQYNVAVGLVEDYWNEGSFWNWVGGTIDAEGESSAEVYVDYLDSCISAIIEGGCDESYTQEECEYLDSMTYESVALKHDYQFMSDLKEHLLNWIDNDELMEGIDKLLFMAKLSKETV